MSNLQDRRELAEQAEIKRHDEDAFAGMRKAGQLAASALDMLTAYVEPGVTTETLDDLILDFAIANNAVP
ncbi:MAG: type I methionyl aminopeptidase, partial [Pseudomonadota bacterium]